MSTIINEEYFKFLDALREQGSVNMFGAAEPLRQMFPDLDAAEAKYILTEWMKTYDKSHRSLATTPTV